MDLLKRDEINFFSINGECLQRRTLDFGSEKKAISEQDKKPEDRTRSIRQRIEKNSIAYCNSSKCTSRAFRGQRPK